MAKFINKATEIRCDSKGNPFAFLFNKKWFRVNHVLEIWKDTGTWWDGEPEKTFFRVETTGGSLYELYTDDTGGRWFLYRIYD
ncbi:MAG: hypothetical protein CVU89_14565 [Firmicutes bacterium HGW-Firmicutes-14]|nr:MAG: hypothetical protein CVU89_14565 [Firmicutes bacterium HGW-Firmicutes-14]